MKNRIQALTLTIALGAMLPLCTPALHAQQTQSTTSTTTTQSGIDPATGAPYTTQKMHEKSAMSTADGTMQHDHSKTATNATTYNPDGTQTTTAQQKTHSTTVVNNPDGSSRETQVHTSTSNTATTPQ
jgi:hypothetical protein